MSYTRHDLTNAVLPNAVLPQYAPGAVPDGLATRRQLAAVGLRKNGQDPVAEIVWPGGSWAGLYDISRAAEKRPMTAGRRRAVEAMLRARRICPQCDTDVGYRIPSRFGVCNRCAG